MTLQGALRYDHVYSWAPAEGNGTDGTSRFSSTPIRFPRTVSVSGYHDLSPRFGVAYDLFGNGKTALKAVPADTWLRRPPTASIRRRAPRATSCGPCRIAPGPTRTPITRWIATC